jgi:hypothetical protein
MAPRPRSGRPWVRQLRLATGVVMFVFVTTHLLNHALGLIAMLVISEPVARRATLDVEDWPRPELTLRNRREPLMVRVLADIERLPALLARRASA